MPVSYFPVVGQIKAAVTDSSTDVGGEPDVRPISCTVIFKPSVPQVYVAADSTVLRLEPIRTRTNTTTGDLETIDESQVELVDNAGLGLQPGELTYLVTFEDVVVPSAKGASVALQQFRFAAPGDGSEVDLGSVVRIPA